MQSGIFTWDADDLHQGHYSVEWLSESEHEAALADLGIMHADF